MWVNICVGRELLPRGTGKSTWVKTEFPDALYIDLLDQALYQSYLRAPELFKEHILASKNKWIIVDEIQRCPELLNYVHQLIENNKLKFVLTGSSARKLKKQSVNLLAGRALVQKFHPLTAIELGKDFVLQTALKFGLLPMSLTSDDPIKFLKSYVGTYLREEVQQEALTRNLSLFSQFLEALAFSQGEVLNTQNIASDVGVDRKTIEAYIQVIEDLMLGIRLPVFQVKAKRKMSSRPKFYYFDVGVYRTLRKKGPLDSEEQIDGPAIETLVLQNLFALIDNRNLSTEIFFYRTAAKVEVDFVLYGEDSFCAIEVKRTQKIRNDDLSALRVFKEDYPKAKCFVFCMETNPRITDDGISIINLEFALKNLEEILFS
jgi:predicted AAA+ superfamily ATPase